MSTTTLRPSGTASGSATVTGAGSAHAALNDDSDSSYIVAPAYGSTVKLDLDNYSLTSGDLIVKAILRLKLKSTGGLGNLRTILDNFDARGVFVNDVSFASTTAQTVTVVAQLDITNGYVGLNTPYWTDANVDTWQLELSTMPGAVNLQVLEAYVDIVHISPPVVTVSAPTGTLTTTNLPTVQWSSTWDSDASAAADHGGEPRLYEVKIFSAAQYGAGGFDPSTSTPTAVQAITSDPYGMVTSWTSSVALPNATYRAYVRIAHLLTNSTSIYYSAWAYSGFVINTTGPTAPSITATADSANGRITIALDDAASGPSTELFELQRSTDGGTTYVPFRALTPSYGSLPAPTGDGAFIVPASGLATVYDYEAANGTLTYYRARALHNYSGIYAAGSWATASATWTSSAWWLKVPETPALNMTIAVRSLEGSQRAARQGVFQPLGATTPVVVTDTRGSERGTLGLRLDTAGERTDLDAILDSRLTALIQGPASADEPDKYVVFGDQDRKRFLDHQIMTKRVDTLQWIEVAAPTGDVTAWS